MVDKNIKKVRILKKDLPNYIGNNDELFYQMRYRIVSEDKNRSSHYSPMTNIESITVETVSGTLVKNGTYSTAIWDDATNNPKYDIFVKFDGGSYIYHGTSPIHTYSFLNTGTVNVRVLVQIEGILKTRNPYLTIFESSVVSLV
jgi:hypothetical protein